MGDPWENYDRLEWLMNRLLIWYVATAVGWVMMMVGRVFENTPTFIVGLAIEGLGVLGFVGILLLALAKRLRRR